MEYAPSHGGQFNGQLNIQFDALVKKVLHGERTDFIRSIQRRADKQTLFSELEDGTAESFTDNHAAETFAEVETEFQVLQYSVFVRDVLLYDALTQIDERERNIILLAFWLDMTDREIADETGMKRRTVADIRRKTYQKIKKILEDKGYDTNSFFTKRET